MNEDTPHILLIDDEKIALSNLSHVLEREGYVVTACRDGESGLAAMQSKEFDLVLTDLRMPGIDGMDVLRHIRETTPDVPVIMITGHATLDSAVEAMKAGAHHYIAKPWDDRDLQDIVREQLTEYVARWVEDLLPYVPILDGPKLMAIIAARGFDR